MHVSLDHLYGKCGKHSSSMHYMASRKNGSEMHDVWSTLLHYPWLCQQGPSRWCVQHEKDDDNSSNVKEQKAGGRHLPMNRS